MLIAIRKQKENEIAVKWYYQSLAFDFVAIGLNSLALALCLLAVLGPKRTAKVLAEKFQVEVIAIPVSLPMS